MKLKTLKDCKDLKEAREVVIKLIKELRKDFPITISPMRMVGKNRLERIEFTIHCFKHFANITEDDLT